MVVHNQSVIHDIGDVGDRVGTIILVGLGDDVDDQTAIVENAARELVVHCTRGRQMRNNNEQMAAPTSTSP